MELSNLSKKDANWERSTQYLLEEINKMYDYLDGSKITSQHHMLVMMVNALLFKLGHRGEMVVPCYYEGIIAKSLEGLLFVYDGQYYSTLFDDYNNMPLRQMDVGHYSLLDLMVLKSVSKNGCRSCGFLSSFIPCRFQKKGMGCPLIGLTKEEMDTRDSIGLHYEWCHWKCVMNELDNNIKFTPNHD